MQLYISYTKYVISQVSTKSRKELFKYSLEMAHSQQSCFFKDIVLKKKIVCSKMLRDCTTHICEIIFE